MLQKKAACTLRLLDSRDITTVSCSNQLDRKVAREDNLR